MQKGITRALSGNAFYSDLQANT